MEHKPTNSPKDPIRLERARKRLAGNNAQRAMTQLRRVICDPARLLIVEALATAELCVNDLALAIERAPAATSQHLRVLRDMDLVTSDRRGTTVYYRLTPAAARQLQTALRGITSAAS